MKQSISGVGRKAEYLRRGQASSSPHQEASSMSRILGNLLALGVIVTFASGARAQSVADYPPAAGHMEYIPPVIPAPGAVGGQYVETFPNYGGYYYQPGPYGAQQITPYVQATPRTRARIARGVRTYSRGYSAPPAPYATQLPTGQLYWPGSFMAPAYTPFSRFQSYGSGYGVSPYGSSFYGGYYKGFPLAN
jgi:hypothetical protein